MPISVSIEERDALTEVVEGQKGTLTDVWTPFAAREWESAEAAFSQHLQDCLFLERLHFEAPDDDGQVNVGMRMHELREVLVRLMARRTAELLIEESAATPTPEQEAFQERARLALSAAARCLKTLGARYEVRYVVVDSETGTACEPTSIRDYALDTCEVLNESEASPAPPLEE